MNAAYADRLISGFFCFPLLFLEEFRINAVGINTILFEFCQFAFTVGAASSRDRVLFQRHLSRLEAAPTIEKSVKIAALRFRLGEE